SGQAVNHDKISDRCCSATVVRMVMLEPDRSSGGRTQSPSSPPRTTAVLCKLATLLHAERSQDLGETHLWHPMSKSSRQTAAPTASNTPPNPSLQRTPPVCCATWQL